ncbi:MAG: aldo/keto reductase [Gammaproteobacteria bacterium]|nr:aldo/keto reductase [Gammaproteobacteria bacterium]
METMQINPLPIKASRIGLGTWAIGGFMWGGTDEAASIKTIIAALESGINLIDTAPVYGFGLAESIIGKAITQWGNRETIIIATKAGIDWEQGKITRNSTPAQIRKEIDASLVRLKTDYIDIYQIHWPDHTVPLEETAEAMHALLREGKIRAIGVSNFSVEQMERFIQIAPIHTSQPPYNLFERDIEKNILPFTEKHQIVTLAYSALCRGLLSGRMHLETTFNGDDVRKADPKFRSPRFDEYLSTIEDLQLFSQQRYGKKILALAVRWILDRGRTIALWGARKPQQLHGLQDVLGWNLNMTDMQKIESILLEHIKDPIGADFLAPPQRPAFMEI